MIHSRTQSCVFRRRHYINWPFFRLHMPDFLILKRSVGNQRHDVRMIQARVSPQQIEREVGERFGSRCCAIEVVGNCERKNRVPGFDLSNLRFIGHVPSRCTSNHDAYAVDDDVRYTFTQSAVAWIQVACWSTEQHQGFCQTTRHVALR